MTTTLTPRERELARHALGLDGRRKQSCRNRYSCSVMSLDGEVWLGMVRREFAQAWLPRGTSFHEFCLTRAGAEGALEPGETLDSEDFPE